MIDKKAKVYLIGAGCEKGQMTLRGIEKIKEADVIIYDDLLDTSILYEVKPECKLIYVGKRANRHSFTQDEINKIIISEATDKACVVRLKGGDPFVFGRGGEEMLALKSAGIICKTIPGVCSGIAVPEHFGIPVTHRQVARSVTLITGHTANGDEINFEALCKLGGTLCFFMSLSQSDAISRGLIEAGMNPDTPVSILSGGYRVNEKRVDGTLGQLGALAQKAHTPAMIVVGEVASFNLNADVVMPLNDVSVTTTGTKYFSGKLKDKLETLGASVLQLPLIDIAPVFDEIPENFAHFDWLVFTSANGIKVFFEYIKTRHVDYRQFAKVKFACIGSGSADMLIEYGFKADFVPSEYTAAALGEELGNLVEKDTSLLILRADNGSKELNRILDKYNVDYRDCHIYNTVAIKSLETTHNQIIDTDFIVFGSGAGVDEFFNSYRLDNNTRIICIGQVCEERVKQYISDSERIYISKKHTADDIVTYLCDIQSDL